MKKFLTPLAIIALLALATSFSPALAENQLQLINADLIVTGQKSADYVTAHTQITNTSSQTIELAVALEVISIDTNHHYSLCAGGLCGPGKTENSVGSANIFLASGATTGIIDYELKYHPFRFDDNYERTTPTDGVSRLRTTFTDVANAENTITFETNFVIGTGGVNEILSGGATVGPNPSRGSVRFSLDRNEAIGGDMKIYDANGRPVKTLKITSANFEADLNELSNGAYFYAFKAGNNYYGSSFVIEK